jgi:hypothetical protein
MRSISEIKRSRKYFLALALVAVVTFVYFRLDRSASTFEEKHQAFTSWAWVVVAIGTAYIGGNALQNGMSGPVDYSIGGHNKSKEVIPDK